MPGTLPEARVTVRNKADTGVLELVKVKTETVVMRMVVMVMQEGEDEAMTPPQITRPSGAGAQLPLPTRSVSCT